MELQALEKCSLVRVLDLALMHVGDLICQRCESQYTQSRKSEISVSVS